ncbi:hypothetical protein Tco_1367033 [Tanacetum coccineum]
MFMMNPPCPLMFAALRWWNRPLKHVKVKWEEMNAEKEEVLNEMQNDEESVDIQNLGANNKGRNGECDEKSIDECDNMKE